MSSSTHKPPPLGVPNSSILDDNGETLALRVSLTMLDDATRPDLSKTDDIYIPGNKLLAVRGVDYIPVTAAKALIATMQKQLIEMKNRTSIAVSDASRHYAVALRNQVTLERDNFKKVIDQLSSKVSELENLTLAKSLELEEAEKSRVKLSLILKEQHQDALDNLKNEYELKLKTLSEQVEVLSQAGASSSDSLKIKISELESELGLQVSKAASRESALKRLEAEKNALQDAISKFQTGRMATTLEEASSSPFSAAKLEGRLIETAQSTPSYQNSIRQLISMTDDVLDRGENLWEEGQERETLTVYREQVVYLETRVPFDSKSHQILVQSLQDSEAQLGNAQPKKAAFLLKSSLEAVLEIMEAELNSSPAPAPPAVENPPSVAEQVGLQAELQQLRAENAALLQRIEALAAEDSQSVEESETEHDSEVPLISEPLVSSVGNRETPLKSVNAVKGSAADSKQQPRKEASSTVGGSEKLKFEKQIKDLQKRLKAQEALVVSLRSSAASQDKSVDKSMDKAAVDKAIEKAVEKARKEWEKKSKEAEKAQRQELEVSARRLKKAQDDLQTERDALAALQRECDDLKQRSGQLGALEGEVTQLRARAAELAGAQVDLQQAQVRVQELEKLYREEMGLRKRYWNVIEDMKGKIRVFARARPVSTAEADRGNMVISSFPDSCTVSLDTNKGMKQFLFDSVFPHQKTQEEVFEECEPLIQSAFDGYNVCIFAYGQTGSGKTHTMVGAPGALGITPRAVNKIFSLVEESKGINQVKISAYMVELYNDNVIDLLYDSRGNRGDPPKLEIKKDDKGIVTIKGVVNQECRSAAELLEVFERGNNSRHVGSTNMNATSSRSHLIFAILLDVYNTQTKKSSLGKISLVDLAGSERVGKTGATAERLKEAQAINKSLSALGNVISALSTNEKFIPYRDNKLTQLMSDSLGGNAKTLMFVNFSPVDYNAEETLSSLVYAARVKLITNSAEKQAETAEIKRLNKIIAKLRAGKKGEEEEEPEDETPRNGKASTLDEGDDSKYNDGPTNEQFE